MLIDKINIQNFRRFNNAEISFSNVLTILAGSNNSGKTSLIHLLDCILRGKNDLTFRDISITKQNDIMNNLNSLFIDDFKENFPETPNKLYEKLLEKIYNKDTGELTFNKDHISVKIYISYAEDESIAIYSQYLMDLDITKKNFYFIVEQNLNKKLFKDLLLLNIETIYNYLKTYINSENAKNKQFFLEKIISIYNKSLEMVYKYGNSDFSITKNMDKKEFSNLFNYSYISADRHLSDQLSGNNKKTLTTSLIDLLNNERRKEVSPQKWKNTTQNMLDTISSSVSGSEIDTQLKEEAGDLLENISKTLGSAGEINIQEITMVIDMEFELLNRILKESIKLNYAIPIDTKKEDIVLLPEESQGLGISNLIYITLELMQYKLNAREGIVNLFIIEEPEAHMHLQMQKSLITFLNNEYDPKKNKCIIQGLITTHSDEVARSVKLKDIRAIRPLDPLSNKICDMSIFLEKYPSDKSFYETFFKINFSNMIFADKAIIYEGDTERMYIEALIYGDKSSEEDTRLPFLNSLSQKYITYAQAGGAYAHKYAHLLKELGIKTLILTDIDYPKLANKYEEIVNEASTNSGLNYYCEKQKIVDIYSWQKNQNTEKNIFIKTQTEKEGYARTLEDAILYEYIKLNNQTFLENNDDKFTVFTLLKKEMWIQIQEDSKFNIVLPNRNSKEKEEEIKTNDIERSTRQIASGMSSNKSNFMYSIIESKKQYVTIPNYIKEGLEWLAKS